MSEFRVQLVPEFKDDTVVLVSMDRQGLDAFRSALVSIDQNQQSVGHVELDESAHVFAIQGDEARIDLGNPTHWRLPKALLHELIEKLDGLKASVRPSHHYDVIVTDRACGDEPLPQRPAASSKPRALGRPAGCMAPSV